MKKFSRIVNVLLSVFTIITVSLLQEGKAQTIICEWDTVYVCPGNNTVFMAMTVKNAHGITAFSLKSMFNNAVCTYVPSQPASLNTPFYVNPKLNMGSLSIGGVGFGQINMGWYTLFPVDFTDDTLFIFQFAYSSGSSPFIWDTIQAGDCEWVGTPIPPGLPTILPCHYHNGLVDLFFPSVVITEQPDDTVICGGNPLNFSIGHQNATEFQWLSSVNGGLSFSNLSNDSVYSGVNSPVLVIANCTNAMNGYQFKCKISDGCSDTLSDIAHLHVLPMLKVNATPDTFSGAGPDITAYVSVQEGTPPHTILWSNGLNTQSFTLPLYNNASHIVSVTDAAGCMATDTVFAHLTNNSKTIAPFDTTCPGNVIIPVELRHINNFASASLSLEFNENVLTYISYENLYPDLNQGTVIAAVMNGKLQFAWYSIYPVTIDSGILAEFVFQGLPGTSLLLWDVQTQGSCQYTDLGLGNLPVQFIDGSVHIGGCGSISGDVSYDNILSTPLTNTKVELWQSGTAIRDQVTNAQGEFSMTGVLNGSYEVSARSNKVWGGGNSADALTIMKYFAGMVPLTGMKLQAADVNASGNINSLDALQVSKRFVSLITDFDSGDWLFTHDSVDIYNNTAIVHLKGICYGDVNGSYYPGAKEGEPPLMRCSGELVQQSPGLVSIPLRTEQEALVASLSLILRFPSDLLQIRAVRMEAEGNLLYHIEGDQLRLSWYSLKPLSIKAGETLLVLDCDILTMISPLQATFVAEAGTLFTDFEGNAIHGIQLHYPEIVLNTGNAELGQNIPNPFLGSTTIPYYLPASGHVRLSISDLPGKEVLVLVDQVMTAGRHEVMLNTPGLGSGIYFCRMEYLVNGEVQRFTRKMMVNY